MVGEGSEEQEGVHPQIFSTSLSGALKEDTSSNSTSAVKTHILPTRKP